MKDMQADFQGYLNIAGIAMTFVGKNIAALINRSVFLPFVKYSESFLSVVVKVVDKLPSDVDVTFQYSFETTNVVMTKGEFVYLVVEGNLEQRIFTRMVSLIVSTILCKYNGMTVHSSVVNISGQAILFSGNSGSGKSTQAYLWNKHTNAVIINHDKALIRKEQYWTVYGSPWSGSTPCYRNEKAQIKTLIFLEHGASNELVRLERREAIRRLFPQLRFFYSSIDVFDRLSDTLASFVEDIPIYLYRCLPDKSAVEYLKHHLFEEGDGFYEN